MFDYDGNLIFNPNKISTGIPADLLIDIQNSQDSIWARFADKTKKYNKDAITTTTVMNIIAIIPNIIFFDFLGGLVITGC